MINKEKHSLNLDEMKDKYIGQKGSGERDEYELRMELLGKMIKTARLHRKLTQEELGQLIGVQKAQISKLENNTNNATLESIVKVFNALKVEINFNVKLESNFLRLS